MSWEAFLVANVTLTAPAVALWLTWITTGSSNGNEEQS